jgi:altronate hydrolase
LIQKKLMEVLEGMKFNSIRIHERDNTAVALIDIPEGALVLVEGLEPFNCKESIPASHKVSLAPIPESGDVIRYGEVIAFASRDIDKGQWVHTHNLKGV